MAKTESMIEKVFNYLDNIPRQAFWGIVLGIMILVTLNPINSPINVTDYTKTVYNIVDNTTSGDVVVVASRNQFMWCVEAASTTIAFLNHLSTKEGVKVIFFPYGPESAFFFQYCLDLSDYPKTKEYGKDYVMLEYVPGLLVTVSLFVNDISSVIRSDFYGKPVDEIPVMEGINSIHDVDIWCTIGSFVQAEVYYVRPASETVKIIDLEQSAVFIWNYMYVTAGLIDGMTNGMVAGGEYEKLMGAPGIGQTGVDALNLIYVLVIGSIIIGNISYFVKRRKGVN